MFLFIDYSRLYIVTHIFERNLKDSGCDTVPLKRTFSWTKRAFGWLIGLFSFRYRTGGANKNTMLKITLSKFTMLDQEPEATCSGNSICAFLQANNQVVLCLCKQLCSAFVSQVSWSPTISVFALSCICQQPD